MLKKSRKFIELVEGLGKIINRGNPEVRDISYDTREVKDGDLFFAWEGVNVDTHLYIKEAEQKGACCFVVEKPINTKLPYVIVENSKKALAIVSQRFFDFPQNKLKFIGITGTNGKTTTSLMIKEIFDNYGFSTGLIGTIWYVYKNKKIKAKWTTPTSYNLYKILSEMVDEGIEWVIMEVTSHALEQNRVEGINFDVAVFTNFTQDHLDFHKTMENYKKAKIKLFRKVKNEGCGCFNVDDSNWIDFYNVNFGKHNILYGLKKVDLKSFKYDAFIKGERLDSKNGLKFFLDYYKKGKGIISLKVKGIFNIYNALASSSVAWFLDIPFEYVKHSLENFEQVPGRFEVFEKDGKIVIVDFAHTPDSLRKILEEARKLSRGKVFVVFGCGGERDYDKRPKMGKIAEDMADFIILTNDNPRNEKPEKIIKEILNGISNKNKVEIIFDRYSAIEYGIKLLGEGEVLVVAGKGHEEYQDFGKYKIKFSDREVVKKLLGLT